MTQHEIEKIISDATGLKSFADNDGMKIFVDADRAEVIPAVEAGLKSNGITFIRKRARKSFKGAQFFVPLRNVGTAFAANWEFA